MLRKIAVAILAALLMSFAVACDGGTQTPQDTKTETQAVTSTATEQATEAQEDAPETAQPTETEDETETETSAPDAETELSTDGATADTTSNGVETANPPDTEAETEIPVVVVSASSRLVVENAAYQKTHINRNVSTLKTRIQSNVGLTLPVARVSSASDELRDGSLLIGDTPCPETQQVKATLPANSYTITAVNNKIVILGSDDSLTAYAIDAFCDLVLTSGMIVDGRIRIPTDYTYTQTLDAPLTIEKMMEDGFDVEAVRTFVLKADPVGDCNIAQGAASDGTYAYLALRNSGDTAAVIAKVRMSDGTLVAVSERLALGHANDMTYNTKKKLLVVVHGQTEGNILTLVNPETLTVVEDVTIEKKAGAITYNPETDTYAIGRGGKNLHILDGELNYVKSYDKPALSGYTAQGMGSDGKYIFFPVSSASKNLLETYDWDGNKVGEISITTGEESESLFYVNGQYYVCFNVNGSQLYEVVFTAVLK